MVLLRRLWAGSGAAPVPPATGTSGTDTTTGGSTGTGGGTQPQSIPDASAPSGGGSSGGGALDGRFLFGMLMGAVMLRFAVRRRFNR
jgi:hypothetical protein